MIKENKEKLVEVLAKKIEHKNIYEALSAFQGEIKPMEKTGHVEFQTKSGMMKFDYTPLGEIMKTIYPILSKHGLSVRHEVTDKGVEAIVTHETYSHGADAVREHTIEEVGKKESNKEYGGIIHNQIRSGIVKIGQGSDMKDTGSAITYARRYTLTMVLGISSEEDKDVSLMEQSGKNAQNFAYNKVKEGLDKAKTEAELTKQTEMLKKELATVEKGKAGALGLSKEDYEALLMYADVREKQMKEGSEDRILEEEK